MSVYSPVALHEFEDSADAAPYLDVSHDNGCDGRKVRVYLGYDFAHSGCAYLSPQQAIDMARALLDAVHGTGWAL